MAFHEFKVDGDRLYGAVGASIQARSAKDGTLLAFFSPLEDSQQAKTEQHFHSLRIIDNYVLAIFNENKQVHVFDKDLKQISMRIFPKKPVSLDVSRDTLFVGDKFGDVYAAPILSTDPVVDADSKPLIEPILGHVSMLTDLVAAEHNNQQYLLTADRDEHIRVSRYPQSFVIERFLFGHTEFVSKARVLPWSPNLLVSAGGDDFVALWDWTTGQLLSTVDLRETISPYLDESHTSIRDPDGGEREITVADLVVVPALQQVVLLCEGTPVLIQLSVVDKTKLNITGISDKLEHKILAIAHEQSSSHVYACLENSSLVALNSSSLAVEHELPPSSLAQNQSQATFASGSTAPWFAVKQLRKRAEF